MYFVIRCESTNIHTPTLLSVSDNIDKLPEGYKIGEKFDNYDDAKVYIDGILIRNCKNYTKFLNKNGLPNKVLQVSEYTIIYIGGDLTINPGLYLVCLYDYNVLRSEYKSIRLATNKEVDTCDVTIIDKDIMVKNIQLTKLYNLRTYEVLFYDERMNTEEIGEIIKFVSTLHDMVSRYYSSILDDVNMKKLLPKEQVKEKNNIRKKLISDKYVNLTAAEINALNSHVFKILSEVLVRAFQMDLNGNKRSTIVRCSNDMMNMCTNTLRRKYWYCEVVEKYEDMDAVD